MHEVVCLMIHSHWQGAEPRSKRIRDRVISVTGYLAIRLLRQGTNTALIGPFCLLRCVHVIDPLSMLVLCSSGKLHCWSQWSVRQQPIEQNQVALLKSCRSSVACAITNGLLAQCSLVRRG